ncbi:MAG: hypothetical protein ACR2J8_14050, partial [Thermomicrobiales bacterium]
MDRDSFDRIARTLAGAATRRDGLKAVLAAVGLSVSGAAAGLAEAAPKGGAKRHAASEQTAKKRPTGEKRPSTQGPCGNGKRKDNICNADAECCTGVCAIHLGKKNKDKQGRCRCLKRGKQCGADKNCCGTLSCYQGRCTLLKPGPNPPTPSSPVPTGSPCTPADTCQSQQATCRKYASGSPAGTYCLLENGGICTAAKECAGQTCSSGVCGQATIPTGQACTNGDTCADAQATCVAYTSTNPAGTYCVLANGESCSGADDCTSQICADDVCSNTPEICDVCPACTYQTVQAAIDGVADGATIKIDAGTYPEDLVIDKDVRLKACNGAEVILFNA